LESIKAAVLRGLIMKNECIERSPMQAVNGKAMRIMVGILSVVLVCILVIISGLLFNSPGKPSPFLDENGNPLAGSISEKVFVKIGGVEQGMFIRGKNLKNPVLLY
jgi:hypothetical protein